MSFYHPKKFFKIMRNQELQNGELRVPKYFVKLHWKNVSNPVAFTLPNGSKQDVFWVEHNGDIWFQKNWETIAKSLIRGHVLVFKYKGGSCFKVEIFGCNTLELDYSNIKVEAEEVVVVSNDNVTNTNGAGTSQRRKGGKRKMNMDLDANQKKIKGSNRGGMIKKAKKCLRTEAVKERVRNYHPLENPSFEVEMSQSYAKGCYLRIPRDFSRKYLTKLEGTARFRVGEDMAIEVKLNFYDVTKSSTVTTGWNTFSKRYNLQLGDVCKFVMTQREPLLFTIIITRAREEPNSKKLKMQGLLFYFS
ncbi:putative transcription factor B3-Domain family [Medicago truncatula]|uniref:Putative transcription factor B3-Domain family n=1 Tax=Medicago truncatula TaxID=3880 RepID=A0A396JNG9_MEDTR|nr:putative transcription factor B3-Domain family [Medicago truncatula]